uniref:Uncharacterized protein n=1 Tax=Rhizophora mucronata TaxID=61149 RepID=A0A2P2ND94_RHIMU
MIIESLVIYNLAECVYKLNGWGW